MILASHGIIASQIASFDADAAAFFARVTAAGGSLSTTEKQAVNQLVLDLKANSLWTPMKAIYPMVGASAAACAQNLKSSSFTGTFTSGWTFASTGVTPNGTSAYMDTSFIPSLNFNSLNDKSFGCYIGTNTNNGADMGLLADGFIGDQLITRLSGLAYNFNSNIESGSVANSDSRGFYISTRKVSTSANYYKNNNNILTVGASTSQGATSFVIGARKINNTIQLPTDRLFSFAFLGDGLTSTQVGNYTTIVQAFQTTLNRNV